MSVGDEKKLQRRLDRCARELEAIRVEAERAGIAHSAAWRMSYMGELSLLDTAEGASYPQGTGISADIKTAYVNDFH